MKEVAMRRTGLAWCALAALLLAACSEDPPNSSPLDAGAPDQLQPDSGPPPDSGKPAPDLACQGSLPAVIPDGGIELLRPTGAYGVGTELRTLVDPARDEPATADTSDKRKLAVRLFYPTDPCPQGSPAALMARAEAKVICSLDAGLCGGPWEQLVVMHARDKAPLVAPSPGVPW